MPVRVQLQRTKGWRMPPNTVSVARPSVWSNPYRVDVYGRSLALALFENSAQGYWDPNLIATISDELAATTYRLHCEWRARHHRHNPMETARIVLRGFNLACFCKADEPCHADFWLRVANPCPHGYQLQNCGLCSADGASPKENHL